MSFNPHPVRCNTSSVFLTFHSRWHLESPFQKAKTVSGWNTICEWPRSQTWDISETVLLFRLRYKTHSQLHRLWTWLGAAGNSWWPGYSWTSTRLCQSSPLQPEDMTEIIFIDSQVTRLVYLLLYFLNGSSFKKTHVPKIIPLPWYNLILTKH